MGDTPELHETTSKTKRKRQHAPDNDDADMNRGPSIKKSYELTDVERKIKEETDPPNGCIMTLINKMEFKLGWCPAEDDAQEQDASDQPSPPTVGKKRKRGLAYKKSKLATTTPADGGKKTPKWAKKDKNGKGENMEKILLFSDSRDDPNQVPENEWIPWRNDWTTDAPTTFIDVRSAEFMMGKDLVIIKSQTSGNIMLIHIMPAGWAAAKTLRDLCFGCGAPKPTYVCELCKVAVYCTPFCQSDDMKKAHTDEVCEQLLMVSMGAYEVASMEKLKNDHDSSAMPPPAVPHAE